MGLIYRKRVRVTPRTTVNLSKSGASVTERVGPVSVNSRGRITFRLGKGFSFRLK